MKLRLSTAVFALFVLIFAIPTFAQTSTTSTISADDNAEGGGATGGNNANGSFIGNAVGGFFGRWFDMVTDTQSEQPHWITPIATTTPRLEQEFRYDIQAQPHNNGVVTDNYGVNKGLEIIPAEEFEIILAEPTYVVNNPDSKQDGLADWQFLVKYRILSKNEENGNYILTAFFQMSLPTGEYQQGALSPIITPTIAYGKGHGNFDVQGTLGISLPTGHTMTIGRNLTSNNAFQYHVFKKFWPETEVNFTHFYQGEHSGNTVVYLTPGLVLGKFHVWDRVGFTIGGGYEIAVTSFHPTNHIGIFSVRFPF